MAREARKVTADWQHPVDIDGKLIPMLEPEMAGLMMGPAIIFRCTERPQKARRCLQCLRSPQAGAVPGRPRDPAFRRFGCNQGTVAQNY